MANDKIFWLEGDYTGRGGYFLKNPLKEFFEKLEAEGLKPVGIKYDGTYNLEIIVEDTNVITDKDIVAV